MSYEMIVGLEIVDDESYASYRKAMTPILENYGGGFRYDFKISEIVKNEEGKPINRVFAIYFRDKVSKESLFKDPKYLEAKRAFFESSVNSTTIISEYER